ncbi:MAG: NADH-quinone oxidoreductase subunit M, partial [Pseudomonadota bacterium]|nr:NADH-quinone oxidoreductase subunit M [Pseudomonadota bacterium]
MANMTGHLLSWLIWLPIFGGFAVLALNDRVVLAKWLSLGISCLALLLSVPLYAGFKTNTAAMQFVERSPWISTIHSEFYIGVDGISMPLILLTTFTTMLIVIASWANVEKRIAQYFAAFLILEGLMIGVFAALDGVLFYVFWEAMLIPMFIIIGVWGGPRRVYATIKFFLYTFIGSLLMLVALIYLYLKSGSYELEVFQRMPLTLNEQTCIFLAFFAAFAVKVPMWPVHTWLPDAHVEAPTGGSVVLAAIMLKMGGYGFLRFSLPIAPDASRELDWLVIGLSLIAVVYIGFVALAQRDMKKLIAYSSIAHMGFVTLGMFIGFQIVAHTGKTTGIELGIDGAVVQMLSHGLVSGAMFLCVGVMYDRVHSREISSYGGVVNTMPKFAAFMVLFALANA